MAYVVALTRSKYQYKLSIPTRLIEVSGLTRQRVVVLSDRGDGSILIKPLKEEEHGNPKDHKP